jgi:hypothetical protein
MEEFGLKLIPIDYFKCPICGDEHEDREHAEKCMKKPLDSPLPTGLIFKDRNPWRPAIYMVDSDFIGQYHIVNHRLRLVKSSEPKIDKEDLYENESIYDVKSNLRQKKYQFLDEFEFEQFRARNIPLILQMRKEKGIADLIRTADINENVLQYGTPEFANLLRHYLRNGSYPMHKPSRR